MGDFQADYFEAFQSMTDCEDLEEDDFEECARGFQSEALRQAEQICAAPKRNFRIQHQYLFATRTDKGGPER
jgi:hypothetical protein